DNPVTSRHTNYIGGSRLSPAVLLGEFRAEEPLLTERGELIRQEVDGWHRLQDGHVWVAYRR
ncbi:hypothetical protein, partial [Mycobacterium canetti]|uniref:hypothetical protein n=1 Tax=Mycobacterium canetti TaxID=78331 RepID=UPI001E335F13